VRPHDEVPQVLRTSCPAVSGPEGRKTIAHGASRGSRVQKDHQPQRGDRRGRLPCAETSREGAKTRRGEGDEGLSFGEDVAGERRPGGFRTGGSRGIPDRRRPLSFAASRLIRFVFRAVVARSRVDRMLAFGERESVAPAGVGCSWGDGTQRSRAGLFSDGPPGLEPRLGPGLRGSVSCRWCPS
jgi:hypothetical protein